MRLLDPDDFLFLRSKSSIDSIKNLYDAHISSPNGKWEEIERDLHTIANRELPRTLRTYLVNTLPLIVIRIIDESHIHPKPYIGL